MGPRLKHLFQNIFRKKRVEQDLDAEIRFYRDTLIEQRMAVGNNEEEARRAAQLELGSVECLKDSIRDVHAGAAIEQIWRDLRYALRGLRNKPGFTAAAVVVLALGIGANSAVFSLVNAFLLKPLDVANPDQLVGLYSRDTKHPDSYRAFSYPDYVSIRDNNNIFSKLMAHQLAMAGVKEGGQTRRVFADIVSVNYFSTLGVPLLKGRSFSRSEERAGGPLTVVVSYSFWKRTGGDALTLGKELRINGHLFTIIGIAPQGFTGTTALVSPEVFLPLGSFHLVADNFENTRKPLSAPDNYALILVGRLNPGITKKEADAQLAVIASRMAKEFPAANKDQMLFVHPLSRLSVSTGPNDDSGMMMPAILLMLLAGAVLLIACLNLANMMLASGAARRKEIAIRLAIGGSRTRIVRQLMTEGLAVAILGGAVGLFLACWSTSLLMASMARLVVPMDLVYNPMPDLRVLAGTLAFCMLSTIIFGLFPAWKLSKPDTWHDLKAGPGEDVHGHARRFFSRRNVLVVAQLSLSLMMLSAAGLFVRSAVRAAHIQPGFSLRGELLVDVDASLANYDEQRTRNVYRELRVRLGRIPGVQSVAMAATVPFGMMHMGKGIMPAVGGSGQHPIFSGFNIVTSSYFQTLGIPLLQGRAFTAAEDDPASKSKVAILNQLAAKQLWPNGNSLGKEIRLDEGNGRSTLCKVVGVVGNVQGTVFGKFGPRVYIPFGQQYQAGMHIHLKVAARGPAAEEHMLETVRQEIRATDQHLPVLGLKTMRENLESSFGFWMVRAAAYMLEIFGGVALFLAVVGLYAVNAYMVGRRTHEIGIRMALGADAAAARRMILNQGLRVVTAGIAIGLVLAIGIGHLVAGLLYNTPGIDPLVLLAASVLLASVALLACYVPARKASRIDPMIALRYE